MKLTLHAAAMNKTDIEQLRAVGFNDDQISIATQVVGYFNYINRIADGLGVDPEEWMSPSAEEWRSKKASDYDVR